ncbi:hypothetical protein CSA17_02235 [bacterium DOLJORAL78_65_58]|nr:MAG: hypothetical protein CSB20_09535 [bacterium DOLZORAL124_64_63]PIE76433.1 MAG: hypothetical protein CSA17_02235 [bacterium DOLJORAL78_65_58]
MNHPLLHPVHKFYIPVMGTGFTIDTPLKVARYGISSTISLVDDVLIEQMRRRISQEMGLPFEEIGDRDEDSRARRITSYLNLLDDLVQAQMRVMKAGLFEQGSELTRYFEMLPDSPLRALYKKMQETLDPVERAHLQDSLRDKIRPGGIDVNIMTKLDRTRLEKGRDMGPKFSDAMSALRGYALSRVRSSLILSAGMNRKLFAYLTEFSDFFPDEAGDIPKRLILKVSDYRSAMVQGKLLARQGLWVSEYRIESGLNCGGHAFGGKGALLGPVLEDFLRERDKLVDQLRDIWVRGLKKMSRPVPSESMLFRVTVQGGIGTAEENELLEKQYHVDGTGWGSPFLLAPDVVNIDQVHLERLQQAGEEDVYLSGSSPLGVPFWCLKTSASEELRRNLIGKGKPGSACPKGFLVSNTEFTKVPICTASRAYQRRKLSQLESLELTDEQRSLARQQVLDKACICHDLAGSATVPHGIDPKATTAVCCGPNTVYFSRVTRLREMVDHIYGRTRLPFKLERPHMFLKELSLHVERLKEEMERRRQGLVDAAPKSVDEVRANLSRGISLYRELADKFVSNQKEEFQSRLEKLRQELEQLRP